MKIRHLLMICLFIIAGSSAMAQRGFPVNDQQPVNIEGLMCGYKIKSLETKQVGDKGNFSRYSVSFWVKNISGQPRVLPFRTNSSGVVVESDNLVQFSCFNATGYRLTSKYAVIKAPANNYMQNGRLIRDGFAIMPGQTLSVDAIMIVPLNEQLNMVAYYIGYSQQLVPVPDAGQLPPQPAQPDIVNQPPPIFDGQNFFQIRNLNYNVFINNQTGVVQCTSIEKGWFSAQWQIIPVPGSNFFKIKNKWKGNYLAVQGTYITLAPDEQSPGTNWLPEAVEGNTFHLKNVDGSGYFSFLNNQVRLTPGTNNPGATWVIQEN